MSQEDAAKIESLPFLSIVIAVYRAKDCLQELRKRLLAALLSTERSFEIIFVEDGGNDGSWEILKNFATTDSRIKAIKLSRNFGQHFAITAGIANARGQWLVVMDCDLQEPPEAIQKLLDLALQGNDIVFTRRIGKKFKLWRRLAAHAWAKALSYTSNTQIDSSMGTLSIFSAKVAEAYLRMGDTHRHYLILMRWLGFTTAYLELPHEQRFRGKSSYSFKKLVTHAIDGIVAQSTRLLLTSIFFGFATSALSLMLGIYVIYLNFTHPAGAPGWASMICVALLIGGSIHLSLGVVGLYLGKTFEQTKKRPLYLIDQKINL